MRISEINFKIPIEGMIDFYERPNVIPSVMYTRFQAAVFVVCNKGHTRPPSILSSGFNDKWIDDVRKGRLHIYQHDFGLGHETMTNQELK